MKSRHCEEQQGQSGRGDEAISFIEVTHADIWEIALVRGPIDIRPLPSRNGPKGFLQAAAGESFFSGSNSGCLQIRFTVSATAIVFRKRKAGYALAPPA